MRHGGLVCPNGKFSECGSEVSTFITWSIMRYLLIQKAKKETIQGSGVVINTSTKEVSLRSIKCT